MPIDWRFMVCIGSAKYIHASQEAIIRGVKEGKSPPTVRIEFFKPAAITIGCYQNVDEEVNVREAKKRGLDIMRRLTSGGAILQSQDAAAWDIYIPDRWPDLPPVIEDSFEYLSKPAIEFFRMMGIDARFRLKNDIEVGGKKISGVAQHREDGVVFHSGTLLLDFDVPLMMRVLKLPIEKLDGKAIKSFEERITTVKREKGFKPSFEKVVDTFKKAVGKVFNVKLEDGELNEFEKSVFAETLKKYKSKKWVYGLRSCKGYEATHIVKTPAGLIRIHGKISSNILENLLITGDFFIYPQRAIYDLEAYLKWTRVEEVNNKVKDFFEERKAKIIGLSPMDLASILEKALTRKNNRTF